MDLNLLSPYVRTALDSRTPADWVVSERILYDYELLYVKEGNVLVRLEDEEYEGLSGDIFFIRPGKRHSIRAAGGKPVRQPHVHFDLVYRPDSPDVKVSFKTREQMTPEELGWIREDMIEGSPYDLPAHIRLRNSATFETLLFQLIHTHAEKAPYADIAAKGILIQLWVHLLGEQFWSRHHQAAGRSDTLQTAKRYLDSRVREDVTLEDVAMQVNMSKYYFVGLFKTAYGVTPMRYHKLARIEKAKEMIQYTQASISEVAEAFGYPDVQAFSRAFRQVEGVPPTYYRPGKARDPGQAGGDGRTQDAASLR